MRRNRRRVNAGVWMFTKGDYGNVKAESKDPPVNFGHLGATRTIALSFCTKMQVFLFIFS
jgi:hypothetical protein